MIVFLENNMYHIYYKRRMIKRTKIARIMTIRRLSNDNVKSNNAKIIIGRNIVIRRLIINVRRSTKEKKVMITIRVIIKQEKITIRIMMERTW